MSFIRHSQPRPRPSHELLPLANRLRVLGKVSETLQDHGTRARDIIGRHAYINIVKSAFWKRENDCNLQ